MFSSSTTISQRQVANRLFTFLLIVGGCFVAAALLVAAVQMIAGERNPGGAMRLATLVQDMVMFIAPALACAFIFRGKSSPWKWLELTSSPTLRIALWAVAAWIASLPAQQALAQWNESISLSAFPAVEAWMKSTEAQAAQAVALMMGGTSIGSLIVNLLLVAVLAGLSEELLFRGTLLHILLRTPGKYQIAVWTAAIIFSAIHFQFYGFFPRLALGLFFGYALVWSGSLWLPILLHVLNNGCIVVLEWMTPGSSQQPVAAFTNTWCVVISVIATALCIFMMWRLRQNPNIKSASSNL